MRRDPFQKDPIAYGELQNPADPAEVARPLRTGNLIDLLPRLFAELSLVPGFERQARQPQVGTGELFRRSQRLHARLVEPRSLVVFRQSIDAENVIDVVPHQAEGDCESACPAPTTSALRIGSPFPARRGTTQGRCGKSRSARSSPARSSSTRNRSAASRRSVGMRAVSALS